jgi:ribonuclease PH
VEIARLIGRCLRSVTDLSVLVDQTLLIDCEVLQADGGTRSACITAASLALTRLQQQWLSAQVIDRPFIKESIAAISVGLINGQPVLDPTYAEDSVCDADFNFVVSRSGNIIEVQGTAEHGPIAWQTLTEIYSLACSGTNTLLALGDTRVCKTAIQVLLSALDATAKPDLSAL